VNARASIKGRFPLDFKVKKGKRLHPMMAKCKIDAMNKRNDQLPTRSSLSEVDAFLSRVAAAPASKPAGRRGRLLFAMDATASREPTWDRACNIQGEMFRETASLGGLETQLCWYRGFEEFHADPWTADSSRLLRHMTGVFCLGGTTQIARVLRHAIAETRKAKVDALVLVGDCMEENLDTLCSLAGELGLLGVPAFLFQEGHDPVAERAFAQLARLSGGAHCRFDAGSAQQLKDLLSAVAVYAAGGRHALEDFGRRRGGSVPFLTRQLNKG
jgi:hypothetical protein